MLGISIKKVESGDYDLNVRYGQDVNTDALLKAIGAFIELEKASPSQNKPIVEPTKVNKKEAVKKPATDVGTLAKEMSPVNQAVLAAAYLYQSEHDGPIAEVRDISEYGQTFKEYAEFMKGRDAKRVSQALRYQFRLLRENDFVDDYPNRVLTSRGIEAAKQVLPTLERLVNLKDKQSDSPQEVAPNGSTLESEVSQDSDFYEQPLSQPMRES